MRKESLLVLWCAAARKWLSVSRQADIQQAESSVRQTSSSKAISMHRVVFLTSDVASGLRHFLDPETIQTLEASSCLNCTMRIITVGKGFNANEHRMWERLHSAYEDSVDHISIDEIPAAIENELVSNLDTLHVSIQFETDIISKSLQQNFDGLSKTGAGC